MTDGITLHDPMYPVRIRVATVARPPCATCHGLACIEIVFYADGSTTPRDSFLHVGDCMAMRCKHGVPVVEALASCAACRDAEAARQAERVSVLVLAIDVSTALYRNGLVDLATTIADGMCTAGGIEASTEDVRGVLRDAGFDEHSSIGDDLLRRVREAVAKEVA